MRPPAKSSLFSQDCIVYGLERLNFGTVGLHLPPQVAVEMFVERIVAFALVVRDSFPARLGNQPGIDGKQPAVDVFEQQA